MHAEHRLGTTGLENTGCTRATGRSTSLECSGFLFGIRLIQSWRRLALRLLITDFSAMTIYREAAAHLQMCSWLPILVLYRMSQSTACFVVALCEFLDIYTFYSFLLLSGRHDANTIVKNASQSYLTKNGALHTHTTCTNKWIRIKQLKKTTQPNSSQVSRGITVDRTPACRAVDHNYKFPSRLQFFPNNLASQVDRLNR